MTDERTNRFQKERIFRDIDAGSRFLKPKAPGLYEGYKKCKPIRQYIRQENKFSINNEFSISLVLICARLGPYRQFSEDVPVDVPEDFSEDLSDDATSCVSEDVPKNSILPLPEDVISHLQEVMVSHP